MPTPPELPVGRLAPSPTGAQHIGNARSYLLAWLSIRSRQGQIVLRIEDIDSPRTRRGAADQAIDDLRWLGLDWDEGPDVGGPSGPYIQTQRASLYEQCLHQLRAAQRVYPCTCTRSDIERAASAPHRGHEGPVYPGTCAERMVADPAALTSPYCWRFRAGSEVIRYVDRFAGQQQCNVAADLGDFVVAKSDGTTSYQLAVVVDDHTMGVTEVLRGDDLLPSTARQLQLYDFFGWQPPAMVHVPLVIGPDGRRLAKRHGDTRIASVRQAGVSSEQLIGVLAWSCGLQASPTPTRARDLLADFDLSRLPSQPFVFDERKLWEIT